MKSLKEERCRAPIAINEHTLVLLRVFKAKNHLEDCWTYDERDFRREPWGSEEESARQLIDQLENEWNIKFLEALTIELVRTIKHHDEWVAGATDGKSPGFASKLMEKLNAVVAEQEDARG